MDRNAEQQKILNDLMVQSKKKAIQAYDVDKKQVVRRSRSTCKKCFYIDVRIAGQAFTEFQCGACQEFSMHHNTAVPKYCDACANKLQICRHCGAALD